MLSFKCVFVQFFPHLKQEGEPADGWVGPEERGGERGPIISPDVPHWGRNDRCTIREEAGNRKMEATRGKAKRRTREIKITYGTVLKKSGMKS